MAGVINDKNDVRIASAQFALHGDAHLSIELWRIWKGGAWEYVVWNVNGEYGKGGRCNGSYFTLAQYSAIPCLVGYVDALKDTELAKLDQAALLGALSEFHWRVGVNIASSGGKLKKEED